MVGSQPRRIEGPGLQHAQGCEIQKLSLVEVRLYGVVIEAVIGLPHWGVEPYFAD